MWMVSAIKTTNTGNSCQIKTTTAATTLFGGMEEQLIAEIHDLYNSLHTYTPSAELSKALVRHSGAQWKRFTSLKKGVRTPIAIIGPSQLQLRRG